MSNGRIICLLATMLSGCGLRHLPAFGPPQSATVTPVPGGVGGGASSSAGRPTPNGTLSVQPALADANTVVTIVFVASTTLESTPLVTVAGRPATLTSQTANTFTYRYVISGQEAPGTAAVEVTATDASGQSLTLRDTITFDFTPPTLGGIVFDPPASNGFISSQVAVSVPSRDTSTVAACEVCVSTGPCPDGAWQPAAYQNDTCEMQGLTCAPGQLLTFYVRATDSAGNTSQVSSSMTCAPAVPSPSTLSISGSGTFVAGTFTITAQLTDPSGPGVMGCQGCVSNDGNCSTWQNGVLTQGICTLTETCDAGNVLVSTRSIDAVGQVSAPTIVPRTCDTQGPTVSAMSLSRIGRDGLQVGYTAHDDGCGVDPNHFAVSYGITANGSAMTPSTLTNQVATGVQLSGLAGCHRYVVSVAATDMCGNTGAVAQTSASVGCGGDGNFVSNGNSWVGSYTSTEAVVADFNADGWPDVAVAKPSGQCVRIRHGLGNGAFDADVNNAYQWCFANGEPGSLAAADFNRDNILDLAVADYALGVVHILLGGGSHGLADGTMTETANYAVNSNATLVIVADFNNDHFVDVGVPSAGNRTFSVLLGNGDGTFQTAKNTPCGLAYGVAAGDFDSDGTVDIVVPDVSSSNATVLFMHGRGDGTFNTAVAYPISAASSYPVSIAVADLNGDGILDLAVPEGNASRVSVLLGRGQNRMGNGSFASAVEFATGSNPVGVALADVNNDGVVDILVSHNDPNDGFGVLLGNRSASRGDGTFASEKQFATPAPGPSFGAPAPADFNGDGLLDVAIPSNGAANFVTLYGSGGPAWPTAAFLANSLVSTNHVPVELYGADMNGDDIIDLITLNSDATASILLGDGLAGIGLGRYTVQNTVAASTASAGTMADMNGDGLLDVVAVDGTTQVEVFINQGDGTLAAGVNSTVAGAQATTSVVAANINGAGSLDLVVADANAAKVFLLLGSASGTSFTSGGSLALSGFTPRSVAVADVNADGITDIIAASASPSGTGSNIAVFIGGASNSHATGGYGGGTLYSAGAGIAGLAVGDINRDGIIDIVTANQVDGTVSLLLGGGTNGRGNGAFTASDTYGVGLSANQITLADVNRDGCLDVLVSMSNGVALLLNKGWTNTSTPWFLPVEITALPGPASTMAVADLDNDGLLDNAVAMPSAAIDVLFGVSLY